MMEHCGTLGYPKFQQKFNYLGHHLMPSQDLRKHSVIYVESIS